MCVTALVAAGAAIAAKGVSTVASISSAKGNKKAALYKAKLEQKQIEEQRRTAQIQAMDTENQRAAAYEQAKASSLAAIGAAGIGEHMSFIQGMDPNQRKQLARDVMNTRLNLAQTESSLADQVGVTEASKSMAKFNAKMQTIGAAADFVQTVGETVAMVNRGGTPKSGGGVKPNSLGGTASVVK